MGSPNALARQRVGAALALLCSLALTATGCKSDAPRSDAGGAGGSDAGRDGKDGGTDAKTCAADGGKNKGKAEACTCNSECQSGFCVDGVCCASACGETCRACNLATSMGDCALVPAGGRPTRQECAASTPATCGQDGTCDGKGACRKYVKGTECKTGTCDGDGIAGALACDGKGACVEPAFTACAPYTCDKSKNRCATRCTTNAQCASEQQCAGGKCGRSSNGAVCEDGSDCASGFCVDGVCCNVACSGPCVSCNQTGSVGHCQYVSIGLPDSDCNGQDRTTCGSTGLCDGQGTCTLYPANTVCAPSSCSGLIENVPRTCDGKGQCQDAQLVDCAPFICSDGACTDSCDPQNADTCESGHACVADTSGGTSAYVCGKRKNGQTCPDSSQCESGFCVDGVCCESACTGPCRSCNLSGSPGKCTNVATGAADPRKVCTDKGIANCSTNGLCDGNGACQSYPVGAECGPSSCTAGAYTPPSTCNAAGQCTASRSRTCSPFVCNGSVCYDACNSDKQCAEGSFCLNGSCGPKPSGANCSAGTECKSGFCAQGVCCDRACTEACMACNLSSSQGICTAVADGAADPQGKCKDTATSTCGTTGACLKGACAFHKQGTSCMAAACASTSSLKPAYTCDGAGKCTEPKVVSCGSFACAEGACKTSCTLDSDCIGFATCIKGSCGLKVDGAACTAPAQCQSGLCTEGVCCNTACTDATTDGLCRTCRGVGTTPAGTCTFVASGDADPRGRCEASAPLAGDCSNDGTCNGAGACRHWSTSTACRKESCSAGEHTMAANCKSDGTCAAAQTTSCSPYTCADSITCRTTCTSSEPSSDQCAPGLTCLVATNKCGEKREAGEACDGDSDCADALVCTNEHVCCGSPCSGGCQSCKTGSCTFIGKGLPPRTSATCEADAGTCGQTGSCDGAGACELPATCTAAHATCPADTHTQYSTTGTCSAEGVCASTGTVSCGTGYLCVDGACATRCTIENQTLTCDAGFTCNGEGFCVPKKEDGEVCSGDADCASGNCEESSAGTDRMCCASACTATEVCVAGACKKKPGQVCSAPAECISDACLQRCCIASCNTGYVCADDGTCKVPQGQACDPAKSDCITGHCACSTSDCSSSVCCDTDCGGNLCKVESGVCATGCTDSDCAPGYYCSASTCTPKKEDGEACGDALECKSGYCGSEGCAAAPPTGALAPGI